MKVSIKNRNPNVFLNSTLCGCKFKYDGEEYNSVLECFNRRKISNRYWHPFTVPVAHMNNMINVIGFLVDCSDNTVYTLDVDVNDRFYGKAYEQFKMVVCCKLFHMYYRQVYQEVEYVKSCDLVIQYDDVYRACEQMIKSVTLNTEKLALCRYCIPVDKVDYCAIVYNGDCEMPKEFNIPECYTVRMSMDTFKALSKKGYSWINKLPKDSTLKVACPTKEEIDDYYWELVRMGGYEPALVNEYVGYKGAYTVIYGNSAVDKIKNELDWDRVYIAG